MNLFTRQKHTHRLEKHIYGYQSRNVGVGGMNKLGVWDLTFTLLYIKQIINKDLLYSTGNSTQYTVITYKRKESGKKWINVYE